MVLAHAKRGWLPHPHRQAHASPFDCRASTTPPGPLATLATVGASGRLAGEQAALQMAAVAQGTSG
jgi:hypothetical protein